MPAHNYSSPELSETLRRWTDDVSEGFALLREWYSMNQLCGFEKLVPDELRGHVAITSQRTEDLLKRLGKKPSEIER